MTGDVRKSGVARALRRSSVVVGLATATAAGSGPAGAAGPPAPPGWDIRFGHRLRGATVDAPFRAEAAPGTRDAALSLRTRLAAEARTGPLWLGAELMDSRVYGIRNRGPRSTSLVNALAILQAYGGVQAPLGEATISARLGRFTMDLGSRRLVARNRFRNTLNNFFGFEGRLSGAEGLDLRMFATLPVRRQPSEPEAIGANRIELDREDFDRVFWGIFARKDPPRLDLRVEGWVFGLHEAEELGDRDLVTVGSRIVFPRGPGRLDGQLEGSVQLGTSPSASPSAPRLDHLAYFVHGTVGYTFATWAEPRCGVSVDVASGDADPDDGSNNRFDTLFGARRFEFGPTGIYGALARSNLASVEGRCSMRPVPELEGIVAVRPAFLASATDTWVTAPLRDSTGEAGSRIGTQVEGRLRWRPEPSPIGFDLGFAVWERGRFVRTLQPDRRGPITAVYLQSTLRLSAAGG